jgi:molybdopterin-containing oxidoreductase family membrane subunit
MATTTTAPAQSGAFPVSLIIGAVGTLLAGGYVLMQLMGQGHAAYNTTNNGVFWGFAIVVYDFLMMLSVGSAMVASLSTVLGLKEYDGLVRRCLWLALATLIGGVAVLFLELGYPLRALIASPTSFATASPLFWKIVLVGAYGIVLLVSCLSASQASGELPRGPLAMLMFALAVAIALVAGSVYGLMSMRPMWVGSGTIVGFLIEAFVGGLALATLVTRLLGDSRTDELIGGRLGRLLLLGLVLHLALVGGRVLSGLYGNQEGLQVWTHFVNTPMFHVGFWGGIVLPLVMLAMPGTRTASTMQLLMAALVLVGLLIHHYEFIIGGQLVPQFKGSWARGLIDYRPSLAEWGLLAVGLFLSWLIYAIGAWRFGAERD